MCGYYSRFLKKHSNFIDPFRHLLSSKNKFKWEAKHDKYFNELKQNFLKTVPLSHYDLKKPFFLQTDASKKGISAILFQMDNLGCERIIAIISRCLTPHEKNYTITELELLAIVYGLIKLQKYLLGSHFKIYTNHLALTFLLRTQFHNLRLARWSSLISNFSFEISHCKGSDNTAADYLSRIVVGKNEEKSEGQLIIAKTSKLKNKEIDKIDKSEEQLMTIIKNLAKYQNTGIETEKIYKRFIDGGEIKKLQDYK